jgi:tetratricopeptide (TPR) repeat protein
MQRSNLSIRVLTYLFAGLSVLALIKGLTIRRILSAPSQQSPSPQRADDCPYKLPAKLQTAEDYNQLAQVERACHQNWDTALKAHKKEIQLDPKSDRAYLNRGRLHYYLKNYRAAIAGYTQLLQRGDKSGLVRARRVLAREALGDLGGAIADYDRVLQVPRTTWQGEMYFLRAGVRLTLGDKQGAIADYRTAKPIIEDQIRLSRTLRPIPAANRDPLAVSKDAGFSSVTYEAMLTEIQRRL